MPPEMAEQVQQVAKEKGRSVSESRREAIRLHMDERLDLMPAALYASVASDRQDVDLSVAAQAKPLKRYALSRQWDVVAEYVDEAGSARLANRPAFQQRLGLSTQCPLHTAMS